MYKPIIAALVAATALATPAFAQDGHHDHDRGGQSQSQGGGNHGQGQHQQAQPQGRVQPQQQFRGGGQPQVQQQAQPQYRGQWNRGGQPGGQWNRGGQPQVQAQVQQPQAFRRGGGQYGNGGYAAQQYRGQGTQAYRGGQNTQAYRGSPDYRGNPGYRGGNAGGWNNNWRSDRRYDWRDYRNENRNAFRLPRYYAPRGYGYGYQRFSIGLTLGRLLYGEQYWIDDPYAYRLPYADGEYRWVRYYNDALLVDIYTGEVVDAEYDIFW
jgi:Ni/Co efflux regulator RcnB